MTKTCKRKFEIILKELEASGKVVTYDVIPRSKYSRFSDEKIKLHIEDVEGTKQLDIDLGCRELGYRHKFEKKIDSLLWHFDNNAKEI